MSMILIFMNILTFDCSPLLLSFIKLAADASESFSTDSNNLFTWNSLIFTLFLLFTTFFWSLILLIRSFVALFVFLTSSFFKRVIIIVNIPFKTTTNKQREQTRHKHNNLIKYNTNGLAIFYSSYTYISISLSLNSFIVLEMFILLFIFIIMYKSYLNKPPPYSILYPFLP